MAIPCLAKISRGHCGRDRLNHQHTSWIAPRNGPPHPHTKMKTLLPIILLTATTALAVPNSPSIPLPTDLTGISNCHPANFSYSIHYTCTFGGAWNLAGRRHANNDGTFTDNFSGTVANTTLQGTFTQAHFNWLSDSNYLCNPSHNWIAASSFSITISGGKVTGSAIIPSVP